MFCEQVIDFCMDYCFMKCLKLLSTPMGKLSYDDKLCIQTFREQGLGATAIISSYPDHKGWKLSSVKKVCSRVDSTDQ